MKFQNPSSNSLIEVATMIGGVVVGSMISKGVIAVIHKPTGATDEATMKKEKNGLLLKRVGIIGVSAGAASAIKSVDTVSQLAKAICFGMSGQQSINLVTDSIPATSKLADASTPAKRFISASLGLGCPGETMLNGRRKSYSRRNRGMGLPEFVIAGEENIFDLAIQKGSLAS